MPRLEKMSKNSYKIFVSTNKTMFFSQFSSYILVATAVDRFQTICYPLMHRIWKPENSYRKIGLAWAISLVFCIPQTLLHGVEGGEDEDKTCCRMVEGLQGELNACAERGEI